MSESTIIAPISEQSEVFSKEIKHWRELHHEFKKNKYSSDDFSHDA